MLIRTIGKPVSLGSFNT